MFADICTNPDRICPCRLGKNPVFCPQGGNAVDAAVAVSFALGVCEPYDSGLGGGGMATYYCAETGESSFLNFRETTPAAQTSILDHNGLEDPALQIGIPGQTAGIYTLWEQYGSMPWEQLLQPAIQLARQGFQVTPNLLGAIELIYGETAGSPEQLDQMARVQMQVFTDRASYLGDTRFVSPAWQQMLDKDYASALLPKLESANTTGFVAADQSGNVIAVTQTLNGHWGSHVYVDGCGFFLNNQLNDFSRNSSSVNALEPGKIPLSSMAPTILLDEAGRPFLALSAPGGLMIWPALVQVIQNYIDYEMELDEALNAPRICARTDFFYYDANFNEALRLDLELMGYSGMSPRQSIARPVGLAWSKDGDMIGSTEQNGDIAEFNDGAALIR